MQLSKQIKIGAIISYVALFLNIVLSLLYTPWMVSQIGKANYGLYTLANSFISIFLLDFGLSASVSRYVAKYRAEENGIEKINAFISTVERLYLAISTAILLVLTILFFFLDTIYKGLSAEEISIFKSLYVIVGVYSVVSFPFLPLSGMINAYEKFIQQKACEMFQKLFAVALVIIALLFKADVRIVVLSNAISGIVTIIIKLMIIKKNIGVKIGVHTFDRTISHQIFAFSIWVTVISLSARCIFNLAPTILGIVSNSGEIALFAPANQLESYYYLFATAINGLFLATVSRYVAQKEEEKILPLAIKVGRYQLIVMGSIFIAFLAAGKQFMNSWMGHDFEGAYYCAILMFVPDLQKFSQQIFDTTILAKNRVKEQAFGYVGMGAICVIVSVILCPKLGAFGSAIGITVSYCFLFVYMNILYKNKMGINIVYFFRKTYAAFAIPFAIGVVVALILPKVFLISGWTAVLVYGGVAAVVYIGACIPVLSAEERMVVKQALKKIINR